MPRIVNLFGKQIDLDAIYEVLFFDGADRTKKKEHDEYYRLQALPDIPQKYEMLAKLPAGMNPNITVMDGTRLLDIVYQHKYIPVFDEEFHATKRLTLMPPDAMQFYIEHSAMLKKLKKR